MPGCFLVEQRDGPAYDPARARREQDGWSEHAAFMDRPNAGARRPNWQVLLRSRGAMEFFEFPEPDAEREPLRERFVRPPWVGPPENVLPGVLALELVLARSELAAVCVTRLEAYATGFGLELLALASGETEELDPLMFGPRRARMRARGGEPDPSPEMLRFGVQFADGRKATNTASMPFGLGARTHLMALRGGESAEPPPGPVLMSRGGGGGERRWRQEMWVWPLPPPGPLALVCEWPAARIPLTRHEIDAERLLQAARRAQPIFAEPSPGGSPAARSG